MPGSYIGGDHSSLNRGNAAAAERIWFASDPHSRGVKRDQGRRQCFRIGASLVRVRIPPL